MDEKKELEIVSDDGSSLDISPVYDHLAGSKPKMQDEKPKHIVVPKIKKEEKTKKKNK